MTTKSRIYVVSPKTSEAGRKVDRRLVRATHPAHALHHVAADQMSVCVASQDDLVTIVLAGGKVETISSEQQEL